MIIVVKKEELTDKPGSVVDNHSSGMYVAIHLKQPTRKLCGSHMALQPAFLFGFAPSGVYPAINVAINAVRSYHTISPLPIKIGGLFSVALSVASLRLAVN